MTARKKRIPTCDRGEAVNLATHVLRGPFVCAPTPKGIRRLCRDVLRMDAHIKMLEKRLKERK